MEQMQYTLYSITVVIFSLLHLLFSFSSSSKPVLIENAALLRMSNGHAAAAADLLGDFSNGGDDPKLMLSNGGGGSAAIKGPLDKQIEVKTSDGRRRITPMYIPPAVETNGEWSRHSFSSERQEVIPHEKRG
jgi:hypothetical protein